MVDIALLRRKIQEKDITISDLACQLGIDKATLYRKMAKGDSFTIGEANNLVSILSLSRAESVAIFFSCSVA